MLSNFSATRACDVDWAPAAKSLEVAVQNPAMVEHATAAVFSLLQTERMIVE
jgi:hypothetical protein